VTQVRVTRIVALALAFALLAPAGAFADNEDGTQVPVDATAVPTVPVVDQVPVAVTPKPAPVIVVRSYSASSERLLVGTAFDLTLTVYNATARRAENVVVSLGQSSGTGASAAATAGGLTVLGTGNAKYLGTLKGQREDAMTFQVMAGPGTTPGALTVPVTVSFEYEGVRQEVAYTIGLLIERNATLSLVTAELPGSVMQGETFDASFEIGNASGFALSGVVLSIEASGAVVTDGSLFLGTMDAAATEAIDVSITPGSAGLLEVVVVVAYRDDFGRPQTFRETRTVTVEAVPESGEVGPDAEVPSEDEGDDNWFVSFIKALFGLGS
jgi:hypothetical protein